MAFRASFSNSVAAIWKMNATSQDNATISAVKLDKPLKSITADHVKQTWPYTQNDTQTG